MKRRKEKKMENYHSQQMQEKNAYEKKIIYTIDIIKNIFPITRLANILNSFELNFTQVCRIH